MINTGIFEAIEKIRRLPIAMGRLASELQQLESKLGISNYEFCKRVTQTRRKRLGKKYSDKLAFNQSDLQEFLLFAKGEKFFPEIPGESGKKRVRNFPLQKGKGVIYDIYATFILIRNLHLPWQAMRQLVSDLKPKYSLRPKKPSNQISGLYDLVKRPTKIKSGRKKMANSLEEDHADFFEKRIAKSSILELICQSSCEHGLLQGIEDEGKKKDLELALILAAIAEKSVLLLALTARYRMWKNEDKLDIKWLEGNYQSINNQIEKLSKEMGKSVLSNEI